MVGFRAPPKEGPHGPRWTLFTNKKYFTLKEDFHGPFHGFGALRLLPADRSAAAAAIIVSVPQLRRLAAVYVLSHSSEYDDASRSELAEVLSMVPTIMCGALRDPAAFAGASNLPALLDVLRVLMTDRQRGAALILNDMLHALRTWSPDCCGGASGGGGWSGLEATCERLLCTGMLKREIVGATLPKPLADKVRHIRKVVHAKAGDTTPGHRLTRAFGTHEERAGRHKIVDMDSLRNAYLLRRLEAHTG